jgi:predicted RNA binding protein YcfA (HicA-like mRNA interferase family)
MKPFKKIKVNFKMPPESPAERLAREHAARRKASGLPDPSHYKQMAAQKQKEIDAMKNEETTVDRLKKYIRPVKKTTPKIEKSTEPAGRTTDHTEWKVTGPSGEVKRFKSKQEAHAHYNSFSEEIEELDEISTQVKTSYRQKAIADIRALRPHAEKGEYKDLAKNIMKKRQAGVNRSVKEEQEQIDEILGFGNQSKVNVTHYVKVNNAAKTTPSGKHLMKFPDRESAERHAAEHKKRNPNHNVKVTTKVDDAPTWHGGTKTRPYSYGMREEIEQIDEMPESSMKVRDVHAHLKKSGWALARSSGGHDIYKHPQAKHHIPVPRHKQLKAPLIRGIMKASKVTEEAEIEEQLEKKGRFVSGQTKMPFKSNTVVTSVKEEKDTREYGYEGDMALNQLATLTRCAEMIKELLKPDTDMPEWVQSKITLATDYIQTAADYMHSEVKEEVELDESIKIGSKVTIHSPGKDYHGQTGHVGEIRNGAHKDAPKTYTVDYGNSQSVQLKATNMKKHKLDEIAVVKTNKEIGTRVVDVGPGGKEYNAKTNRAWDTAHKKQPQGAEFAAQRRKERLTKNGRMDEDAEQIDEARPSQRHPLEGHEYHKKSNDALVHIAKDAREAAEAMKSHNPTAENKYRDQANDSATVRYYRQKHGMQDWYKKKYGHVNEANSPSTEVPTQDPLMDKGKPMSRKAQIVKSVAKGTKDKFFDKPELSGTIEKN